MSSSRRFTFAELSTICLLLTAPIIRLALLTGPAGSDDLNYFHFSQQLAHLEHFTQLHHHAGRLVFLLFVGVPAALFGSITSGAIVNVFVLSLRDLLVVWFVRRETDMACAAIAAAIVSLNAISMTYAGIMIPDPLMSLLMIASAIAMHIGLSRSATSRGRTIVLAGALTAMSYSAKDPGILLAAPSMIYLLIAPGFTIRERVRLGACYVIGLVAFAAFEMLCYHFISGDFLYRTHAISKIHNATIVEQPNLLEFVRAIYWNLRLVTTFAVASTGVLIASAIVFVLALATRARLAFFSASGLFLGCYLIFGSSSFTRYMPLPVQDRYFEPLVAFLAVAAAALTFRLRARRRLPALRVAAIGVALMVVGSLPAVAANAGDVAFSGVGRNAAIALRALHAARPEVPIVVSPMLHRMMEPFVSAELFASLQPMTDLRPGEAFYLAHPWETATPSTPLLTRMKQLPVYLVVDEDQRYLGRYAIEAKPADRGAIVHIGGQ